MPTNHAPPSSRGCQGDRTRRTRSTRGRQYCLAFRRSSRHKLTHGNTHAYRRPHTRARTHPHAEARTLARSHTRTRHTTHACNTQSTHTARNKHTNSATTRTNTDIAHTTQTQTHTFVVVGQHDLSRPNRQLDRRRSDVDGLAHVRHWHHHRPPIARLRRPKAGLEPASAERRKKSGTDASEEAVTPAAATHQQGTPSCWRHGEGLGEGAR